MKKEQNTRAIRMKRILTLLIVLEATLFVFMMLSFVLPYAEVVMAGVGQNNVTVRTLLQVGNVFPELYQVRINNGAGSIDLTPNTTTVVVVNITARDYNGEGDIANITARLFDNVGSSYAGSDDNNNHYTNNSCAINYTYGDAYEVSALCSFSVWYYANNATWNATVVVTDNSSYSDMNSSTSVVNTLLALSLPDTINYGTVNATQVSQENITNVTNAGNVMLNLSLSGYAVTPGDGWAMNCTLGNLKNISLAYERYNLTSSNPGMPMSLSDFNSNYTNISSNVIVRQLNLPQRFNDTLQYVDDTNSTYWRIYVPVGVAGSCSGNIVFGAVQSSAT